MRRARTDTKNIRRMGGALVCAALLHLALLAAIEVCAIPPDASFQSNRPTVTQMQLTLPEAHNEPASRTTTKGISDGPSQTESTVKEAERNTSNPTVDTMKTTKNKSIENTSMAKIQEKGNAPNVRKTTPLDDNSNTDRNAKSENSIDSERPTLGKIFSPQAAEALTQSSSRIPGHQSSLGQSETEQKKFTVYLQQLIEQYRRYPMAARRRNIEGAVEFSVHVNREGALAALTLSSSSGSRILDKAAEDLLEKVFPVDYPMQDYVRTTIRITYRLTEV